MSNKNLVLIGGKSATGKTASLRDLQDPEGVLYLNCEAGKELPFPAKFKQIVVSNPLLIPAIFAEAEKQPVHTIVVDSLTYLMDLYESTQVIPAKDGRKAWGEYAQFFKNLMQQHVANSTKNVVFLAHTMDVLNESEMIMETLVKVKGSLMNQGIESYFNNVISCKKVPLDKLKDQDSDLLEITPQEQALGFKYVYQTQLTKETVNERIRGPMGMWETKETYIDNNLQSVIDRLHQYYGG